MGRKKKADEPTTLCENCGATVPVNQTHSCPDCGRDPFCPSCVCENCDGDDDDEDTYPEGDDGEDEDE